MRAEADGYTLLLKTDPAPVEVGRTAVVSVRIEDGQGSAVRACNASFRQHMPGMEMSTDDVIVQLREERSGVYSGESPEYSMGGDWRIEVTFECGPRRGAGHFDFHVDWPE